MKIPLYYIIFFLTKRTSLVPTHCFVQQITKTIFVYNLSCATTARNTYGASSLNQGKRPNRITEIENLHTFNGTYLHDGNM